MNRPEGAVLDPHPPGHPALEQEPDEYDPCSPCVDDHEQSLPAMPPPTPVLNSARAGDVHCQSSTGNGEKRSILKV